MLKINWYAYIARAFTTSLEFKITIDKGKPFTFLKLLEYNFFSSVYDDDDDVSVKEMYKIDDVLGEGTCSVVYLAERRDARDGLVAIKVIERPQYQQEMHQQHEVKKI